MTTFYRVDGGKLTLAEYRRMSPDLFSFVIAAGLKLVGMPIRFNFAVPRPDRLFVVEFDDLPAAARKGMQHSVRDAERAGLRLAFCHRLQVPEPNRLGVAAVFLDDAEETALSVLYSRHDRHRELQLSAVSRFPDDTLACTTTIRKTMVPVPGSDVERYPGADVATIVERHRAHLDRLTGQGLVPVRLDPDRLPEFVHECELRYVDFHIGRGVFVPMTDAELDVIAGG